MRYRIHVAALLLFAAPLAAGSVDKSYKEARPVLDAGIRAMGGLEALHGIKDVWRASTGTGYNQGQSLMPDAPLTTRSIQVTSLFDFAGRRSDAETVTIPASGPPTKTRAVLDGESLLGYNLVTNVLTPSSPGAVAAARTAMRRDPAVLLLTALSRSETLRSLGEETIDGTKHRVITFADSDGAQIGLFFDAASGLLTRFDTLADNAVLGDTLTENALLDYREVPVGAGRVRLPGRVVTRVAGEITLDFKHSDIKVNQNAAAPLYAPPKDALTVPPAPPGSGVAVTKLGEDVYFAAGGSHHSLIVAFKDHVVVVEAPLNEERSLAVMAKLAEIVPGKPVKYVVPTHYHFDHSGGLRTYIAKGVTILTTPGNAAFIERLASAPHTIRPDILSREPRKPVIETFTGKKVLSDGARTLELHDIGPSPHVMECVIAYLPREKVLFESDLLTIPVQGPYPPASPALVDLADKIRRLGLAVETIAPGHGRMGTLDDLKAALAVRATP
jgi:glyoxylase-like metal-dependent hydrolase (beta-lactamase superfamily II)